MGELKELPMLRGGKEHGGEDHQEGRKNDRDEGGDDPKADAAAVIAEHEPFRPFAKGFREEAAYFPEQARLLKGVSEFWQSFTTLGPGNGRSDAEGEGGLGRRVTIGDGVTVHCQGTAETEIPVIA